MNREIKQEMSNLIEEMAPKITWDDISPISDLSNIFVDGFKNKIDLSEELSRRNILEEFIGNQQNKINEIKSTK